MIYVIAAICKRVCVAAISLDAEETYGVVQKIGSGVFCDVGITVEKIQIIPGGNRR